MISEMLVVRPLTLLKFRVIYVFHFTIQRYFMYLVSYKPNILDYGKLTRVMKFFLSDGKVVRAGKHFLTHGKLARGHLP